MKAQRALDPEGGKHRLVGQSKAVKKLCAEIDVASRTDSNVLLIGETGVGKEVAACLIHRKSARAPYSMVTLNCGALPHHLIESELYGYERGAFTGAEKQTIGKLEAANGGTIFFDEVGEMLYTAQVSLLRALAQREFYRLGGTKLIYVDVRIIAATNCDLEAMMDL